MASYGNNDAGPIIRIGDAADRDQIVLRACGFFAQTMDLRTLAGASLNGSGVASYVAIGLRSGDVVSNITLYITNAGVGVTLSKVALYSSTGVQLAASGDQGTNWQSVGAKTVPVATPYVVPSTATYYVAALSVAGTVPGMARGAGSVTFSSFAMAGSVAFFYGQSGLADLPAPATFATGLTNAACFWFGLS